MANPTNSTKVSCMATSIIPKSVFRLNQNISVGYGEVPATVCPDSGIEGWGLPGGGITFSEAVALEWAIKIDREIRSTITNIKQLASSG